jgi:hypothetical protein
VLSGPLGSSSPSVSLNLLELRTDFGVQMMNMAKLVWAFDISLQEHVHTDDSMQSGYEGGFLVCPKRFPLILNPRSTQHVAIIDAEMEQVQPFLNSFKS